MKIRKLVSTLLLLSMSFSILHAYTISFFEENHHNVHEYVQEFSKLSSHDEIGEICDIHYEFHIVYLPPEPMQFHTQTLPDKLSVAYHLSYQFQTIDDFLKPPIV